MKLAHDGEPSSGLVERLARVETQIARFASDLESEKRTRAKVNEDMEQRLREIEKSNWKSAGMIAVIVIVVNIIAPLILKLIHP